jgi:cupin 2 domain-containing protein
MNTNRPIITKLFETTGLAIGDEEFQETLFEGRQFRVERIISRGQITAPDQWYEQPRDEWVLLAAGNASLEIENDCLLHLCAGDCLMLPAGLRHRVTYTSKVTPCVWLAIHFDK